MSEVFFPETPPGLWACMEAHPEAQCMAGGTDVLVRRRLSPRPAPPLICLERLPGLRGVEDLGDALRLGATCTLAGLLAHPLILRHCPVLCQAMAVLGSPLVRNAATLGGNCCTASPAGDTLPALTVLNARVELMQAHGTRTLPMQEFLLGPGRTALSANEILSAVIVPKPRPGALQHYEKVGRRKALAVALVSLASLLETDATGCVTSARLAWGGVGPTVMRVPEAERLLCGQRLDPENLTRAAAIVREAVRPIDDVRADAACRRSIAGNLLLRLAT